MSMKTMMRMMTIPGLSGTHQLENRRMESMRNAQANLSRQTRSRLVTSAIDQPDENGERQGEITQPNDEELVRAISMLVQSGISESYSGMLPRPSDFNKYPADVQERMCRWNDAFTVDESNRQNQLVKAEIDRSEPQRHVGQRRFVRGRIADELHIVLGHVESMVVWFPGGSSGDHNRQPVRADRVKKQPRQGKKHRTRTGERRPTKRATFTS